VSARAYVEGAIPIFACVTDEKPVRMVGHRHKTHDLPNATPMLYH